MGWYGVLRAVDTSSTDWKQHNRRRAVRGLPCCLQQGAATLLLLSSPWETMFAGTRA